MKRLLLGLLGALCVCAPAVPQDAPAPSASKDSAAAAKPDYSQEPFVFQQYSTKIRFENDGTGERDYVARILVQSDAGVQALGELTFGYNSANFLIANFASSRMSGAYALASRMRRLD